MRTGKLLQPEAGLLAGIAQFGVAGEDHQDVHVILQSFPTSTQMAANGADREIGTSNA